MSDRASSAMEAFRRVVEEHFLNPPSTWVVVKKGDRNWWIAPESGEYAYERFETKRAAEEALESGRHSYGRIWQERDEWYRQTSNDPRNRELTAQELAVIAEYTG